MDNVALCFNTSSNRRPTLLFPKRKGFEDEFHSGWSYRNVNVPKANKEQARTANVSLHSDIANVGLF